MTKVRCQISNVPFALLCAISLHASLVFSQGSLGTTATRNVERTPTAASCTLISPTPSGKVCGVKGDIPGGGYSSPEFAENSTVTTLQHCKALCTQRTYNPYGSYSYVPGVPAFCSGFAFDSTANFCELFAEKSPSESNFQPDPSSSVVFYDVGCFDCNFPCPTSPGHNLINDGGFEYSSELLGPWANYHSTLPELVPEGDHSATAIFCPFGGSGCFLRQWHNFCSGQSYTFSVDMKVISNATIAQAKPGYVQMIIGDLDVLAAIHWHQEFKSPSGWQRLFMTFIPQDEEIPIYPDYFYNAPTNLQVIMNPDGDNGSEGSTNGAIVGILMDNFRIFAAPSSFKTRGKSAYKNGGFESGKLSPWKATLYSNGGYPEGKYKIVSPGLGPDSKYAFEYTTGPGAGFSLSQKTTSIEKGKTYELSFDFESNDQTPQVYINHAKSQSTVEFTPDGAYDTSPFSRVFTALEDNPEVDIFFFPHSEGYPKKDVVIVDNIVLKEVVLAD